MLAPLTQADLLDGVARATDEAWLTGLRLRPSGGYAVVQAYAAIGARVALAAWRAHRGAFVSLASGGAYSVGTVMLSRPTAAAGAVVVKAGSTVYASSTRRVYVTTEDAAFGALDLGPVAVAVRAVEQGYEYDARGARTTASGATLPGLVDTPDVLVLDPPYGDATITVAQTSDITGGCFPHLDALGHDRGVVREPGEGDTRYRQRVRSLPDVVTPGAILRIANAALAVYGLTAELIEAGSMALGLFYGAAAGTVNPDYDRTLFCLDDPRDQDNPFRNRLLDSATFRAAFIVAIPRLPTVREHAFISDDTGLTPAARVAPVTGGSRGVAVYDAPRSLAPYTVLDGYDAAHRAVTAGLARTLRVSKAAGVRGILAVVAP